jgi:hypothetical protein
MTTTENTIVLMEDLLKLLREREIRLYISLAMEIKDKEKLELMRSGAYMAFESIQDLALVAQAKSKQVANA